MQNCSGVALMARSMLLVGSLLLVAAPSQAVTLTVELRSDGVLIDTLDEVDMGCAGGAIVFCSSGPQTIGDYEINNLNVTLNTGAGFMNTNLAFENQGPDTERLTVDIIWGIGALGPSTLTSGSISGSLTDGITGSQDNASTLSTVVGSAFYTALIDGGVYDTLYPHVSSFSTADSVAVPTQDFGMPSPSQAGPAVTSSIGIRYDLTLTHEDQASFTANFRAVAVPEPSTAAILGIGLAVLARIGRRTR